MARLLVTGGAGFIGANFVRLWRARHPGDDIVVLDALTYAGNRSNLADIPEVSLVVGNICDTPLVEALMMRHQIDKIVHFAAESHVDRSIDGPDAFVETNILGTHSLLKAAKRLWLDHGSGRPHRFHHISTDEIYGSLDLDGTPFRETACYLPNSPYAATKAGSDHLVRAYHHTYGLETTISKCSNNYGPYQFPEKLIPLFTINVLLGKPLPLYGDGMHVRDWLHVADHCLGIERVLQSGRPGEMYNIGGGQQLPNLELAREICRSIDNAFNHDPDLCRRFPRAPAANGEPSISLIMHVPDRPGHDRRYAIDDSKAREELGYASHQNFADGFTETLRWYLNNEIWWRPLLL